MPDIVQCYIVCRCCYVQHMPIFEERESLSVKTLKSFADIKKELVMFALVKYGRSSSLMDFSIKDSYKFCGLSWLFQ